MLLGAFGDPGHAFPMIALGRALAARGHHVTVQTWRRWQADVEAEGLDFAPAPEYQVFPSGPEPLDFYEAVVHAAADTRPLVRELQPDIVVADILTLAPALAAELEGRPYATLIPHVYPHGAPEAPIYSLGARMPRSAVGRSFWRHAQRVVAPGLERGRRELNDTRAQLHLGPLDYVHNGISRELALVATFPQLEYPRTWPAPVHVVGPLMWEPPALDVELPVGGGSTAWRPTRRSCSSPRPPPRTRSTRCCAPRCAGSPTLPSACSPPTTGACRLARSQCPTTRVSSSGSPTRAPCPSATSLSATPATARSCARFPRGARSSPARPSGI